MSEANEPKKQLETSRGGSGRKRKTAVGSGDGGDIYNFDPGATGGDEVPPANVTAVLCDRSQLIRDGWKAMLAQLVKIVGEADDGPTAIKITAESRPDIAIIDLDLTAEGALDVCKESVEHSSVIIATNSYYATKCFHRLTRFKVRAIILKSSGPGALFDAIRIGTNSCTFIDPKVLPLMRQRPALCQTNLTDSEQEVLIRLDLKNIEIADELDIPLRRVERCIQAILAKLKSPTRTSAALRAVQLGYILLPRMPRDVNGRSEEEVRAEQHAREAIARRRCSEE